MQFPQRMRNSCPGASISGYNNYNKEANFMAHLSSKQKALIFVLIVAFTLVAASAFAAQEGEAGNPFVGTFWSLVPPIIAIALVLITKEVHSSLFAGILPFCRHSRRRVFHCKRESCQRHAYHGG